VSLENRRSQAAHFRSTLFGSNNNHDSTRDDMRRNPRHKNMRAGLCVFFQKRGASVPCMAIACVYMQRVSKTQTDKQIYKETHSFGCLLVCLFVRGVSPMCGRSAILDRNIKRDAKIRNEPVHVYMYMLILDL